MEDIGIIGYSNRYEWSMGQSQIKHSWLLLFKRKFILFLGVLKM